MGLTDDKLMYAACPTHMMLLSIPNFVDFWALSRNKIIEIKSLEFSHREPRLIARSEDSTIRVFKRDSAKSLTCVLPIPRINEFGHVRCIAYSRNSNIIYSLVDKSQELWIYFTKTNPATHIEVWHLNVIQEMQFDTELSNKYSMKNYGTLSSHKTIDYRLVNNDVAQKITSACVIESTPIKYFNGNDLHEDARDSFLLLGRQNGSILFCDPIIKGKKYCLFYCDKDPIVEMYQDLYYNCLVTKIEQDKHYCIKYWSLPDLELKKEFYSLKSMSCFARIDDYVLVGHEDGTIELIKLGDEHKSSALFADTIDTNSEKSAKYEHKESVKIIDASQSVKIYLSCSIDGNIKIWSQTKALLAEVYLDETLSYACFLNKKSDIIIGWRNHLFIIYMDTSQLFLSSLLSDIL
jgi:WD40 repeat protein